MKNIKIGSVQLYRLLVGECRYAYTRNNHLQPSCAYDEVKEFLPKMYKADPAVALDTAKQICTECISFELGTHFYDGLDDEFGNRERAIDFINYLLEFINSKYTSGKYEPYNYGFFKELVDKGTELKFNVYKIRTFDFKYENINRVKKELIDKNLSLSDAHIRLFDEIIGEDLVYYNQRKIKENKYSTRVIGTAYKILEPSKRAGDVYLIILANEGE